MTQFLISVEQSGRRLDRVILNYLPLASESFIQKMLRKKNITLNKKRAKGSDRVTKGDLVELFLSDETVKKFKTPTPDMKKELSEKVFMYKEAFRDIKGDGARKITAVYEDDAVLILNKPAGVLSQSAREGEPSLNEWVVGYLLEKGDIKEESLLVFRPSVASRLDRNTSGLITAVKSAEAAREFSLLQKSGRLVKTYHTVVCGVLKKDGSVLGTVEKNVTAKKGGMRIFARVRKDEQSAPDKIALAYKPLAVSESENLTLLSVRLYDGKLHQIRAQMAAMGHPVIGDYKYGNRVRNDEFKARFGLNHHLLHSRALSFPDMKDSFTSLKGLSGCNLVAAYPDYFEQIVNEIFNIGGR